MAVLASLCMVGSARAAVSQAETRTLVGYVVSDPELARHPERVAAVARRDGSLDALGIKPVSRTENGKTVLSPRAAEDPRYEPRYLVDSAQFDGGRAPADPYRYINHPAECWHNASESDEAGWIKNRFSYCQVKVNWALDLECTGTRCRMIGYATVRDTLIGYGKIGGDPAKPERRFADFQLVSTQIVTDGTFDKPAARMKATITCAGEYRVKNGDLGNEDACHPQAGRGAREDPLPAWKANPQTWFTLQSEAYPASPERGEQLAHGVFRIEYEFAPGDGVNISFTKSFEGSMRFDSAAYLWDKQGSVFDRTVPGLSFAYDDRRVARHAKFVRESVADPGATWPVKADKKLLGWLPTHADSLHRVARGLGHDYLVDGNRDTAKAACAAPGMPAPLPDEPTPVDCADYAYATTYEGAAGWLDPDKHKNDFAVRWVGEDQTREAAKRLHAWYQTHRILDVDLLVPERHNALDPLDQERFFLSAS
ncbi:hypothetical protein [Amycolatopsis sp. NPDC004079]|uniref:hypothetical protein n=1 Tax=Amycolatopsis sp. NPDC004079 TaxID=3154549 RepID=UPI0033BEB04A